MSAMEDREIVTLKRMVNAMEIELKAYRHTANNIKANQEHLRDLYKEVFESKYVGFDCTEKPLIYMD